MGRIDLPIARDARHPLLKRKVSSTGKGRKRNTWLETDQQRLHSLISQLHTGRTHQVTAYFSAIGVLFRAMTCMGGRMDLSIGETGVALL